MLLNVFKSLSLFIVLCTIVNCSKNKSTSTQTHNTKTNQVSIPLGSDLVTLDPARTQDTGTISVLQNVYEGLIAYNQKNKVEPCLAHKWDISKDGKKYTFHLKKGVQFHNGKELKAEDVKYSFERACSKAIASPVAAVFLSDIVGAKDKLQDKVEEISGIKIIDPYTVEVTLEKPLPYFISKLAYIATSIVPKGYAPQTELTKVEQSIGTGPYRLTNYIRNQEVRLSAHPNYHGKKIEVETIRIPIIKDPLTAINSYKKGLIDYCEIPSQGVKAIQEDLVFRNQLHNIGNAKISYLEFSPKARPFNKKEVRQAIAMAIDKEKIVNGPLEGTVEVANVFIPKGTPGYRPNAREFEFNPEKARQLLAKAGYPNGKNLPTPTIYIPADQLDIKRTMENITMQLKDNLNININVKPLELCTLLAKLNAKQLSARFTTWIPDYLDPAHAISDRFPTGAARNRRHYSNPEVDKLCKQADSHPDLKERLKLYGLAEDIILNDAVVIPINYGKIYYLKKDKIQGLLHNQLGLMPYTHLSIKPY